MIDLIRKQEMWQNATMLIEIILIVLLLIAWLVIFLYYKKKNSQIEEISMEAEPNELETEDALFLIEDEEAEEVEDMSFEEEDEMYDETPQTKLIDSIEYTTRYKYGFNAKLICACTEIQGRYREIQKEIYKYPKMRCRHSFRHIRISIGMDKVGVLFFRGKTLCIALALDPAEYVDSKYIGKDISSIKKYETTPFLYKITSTRKVRYCKELLKVIAEKYQLREKIVEQEEIVIPILSKSEMLQQGLIKASITERDVSLPYVFKS